MKTIPFTAAHTYIAHIWQYSAREQIVLCSNGQNTLINKAVSKTIYKDLKRVITIHSAQEKYRSFFINDNLDWPEIYSLLHRVTLDTKMREFQFKLLNRYVVTNAFLYKIGVVPSPACSFCGKENESFEHILIHCNYAKEFWAEVIKWLCTLNVNIITKKLCLECQIAKTSYLSITCY